MGILIVTLNSIWCLGTSCKDAWNKIIFSDERWNCILLRENLTEGIQESETTHITQQKQICLGERVWCFGDALKMTVQESSLKLAVTWSFQYLQLLKKNLIPDLYECEIFQQDRVPGHRSCVTQQSLIDEGVTVLKDLPAQSHDWNIIEKRRQN